MGSSATTGMKSLVFVIVAGLTGFWLWVVWNTLGTPTQYDAAGNVVLDEFTRAKDILILILPLMTAVVGYWAGAEGKDKVEEKAQKAQDLATAEQTRADVSHRQLVAVMGVSDDDIIDRARDAIPGVFPERS